MPMAMVWLRCPIVMLLALASPFRRRVLVLVVFLLLHAQEGLYPRTVPSGLARRMRRVGRLMGRFSSRVARTTLCVATAGR